VAWKLGLPAHMAFLDGRLDEAVMHWNKVAASAQELGISSVGPSEVRLAPLRILFAVGRGSVQELAVLEPLVGRIAMSGRASILALLGRHAEVRAIREQFGDIGADDDESAVSILLNLLDAAVLGADEATVRALSRRLVPIADEIDVASGWPFGGSVARLLGQGAALLGQPSEARTYFEQALVVCAKVRFRPEAALTHLQLAELLLEHYPAEQQKAQEHLDFAIDEFRAMKMQPSLERALRHKGLLHA
jgi:tetratricopeptide (TPR) repeat protein